jgi:predicted cobalt transporter CbtA
VTLPVISWDISRHLSEEYPSLERVLETIYGSPKTNQQKSVLPQIIGHNYVVWGFVPLVQYLVIDVQESVLLHSYLTTQLSQIYTA